MIKPIETVYKGYRFRSRLEARWAVFFDAAGISYQYEPEGFEVPRDSEDCVRYLPDFYLPDIGTYVEVKPNYEHLMDEKEKLGWCIDFNGPLAKGLLILGQIPYYPDTASFLPAFIQFYWDSGVRVRLVHFDVHEHLSYAKVFRQRGVLPDLLMGRDFGACATQTLPELEDRDFIGHDGYFKAFTERLYVLDEIPYRVLDNHVFILSDADRENVAIYYQECFEKARQARFEHGETPNKSV